MSSVYESAGRGFRRARETEQRWAGGVLERGVEAEDCECVSPALLDEAADIISVCGSAMVKMSDNNQWVDREREDRWMMCREGKVVGMA